MRLTLLIYFAVKTISLSQKNACLQNGHFVLLASILALGPAWLLGNLDSHKGE